MIDLMKYTYLMDTDKIKEELDSLYKKYQEILEKAEKMGEELNEARAILYLTGQIYCEDIAVKAIERRLHLLKSPLPINEFLNLIDTNSEKLEELRKDPLFKILEEFYNIIKEYKNKYGKGKYYLDEERFIKAYNLFQKTDESIGYKGSFNKKDMELMD